MSSTKVKKEKNFKSKIKEPLHKLVQDSSSHGIPRILKSRTWFTKLMWIFSFLASATYCAFLIKITISDYLKHDFITRIEQFNEIPALFPTVTICNLNTFQTNKSLEFIDKHINKNSTDTATLLLLSEIFLLNDSTKQSFSYPLNESLIKCRFNGIPCSSYNFEWIFYSFLGNCFSFNSGKDALGNSQTMKKISRAGTLNGLHLELFVGFPDLIPEFNRNSGYHIMINNHTIKPLFNELIDVAPGTETNININRVLTQKLPYPYNDCMINLNKIDAFDSDLFRAINRSNRAYRQKDCFDLCYQNEVIKQCSCFLTSLEKLAGMKPCLSLKEIGCSSNVWKSFLSSDVKKICSPFCPLECDSMRFRVSSSFSNYPNMKYAEKLMNNPLVKSKYSNETLTYEKLKLSVLSMNIYYDELSYTFISQQAKMQLFDLVSNIGGLLGLFLGVSFLTLAEIIEALIEVCHILCSSLNKKKEPIKKQEDVDEKESFSNKQERKGFMYNF